MKKKSVLIIGIGRLGTQIAEKFQNRGNEVMLLDNDKEVIERCSSRFNDARIADYTSEDVLRRLDAAAFDLCFITVGNNFEASMQTTYLLKKLGAKFVSARARDDMQYNLLIKAGADEIIFADGEIAENLVVRHSGGNVYNYIPIGGGYAVYEVAVPENWIGRSIIEMDVRRKHRLNIIAIRNGETLNPSPLPEYRFKELDVLLVVGQYDDVVAISG